MIPMKERAKKLVLEGVLAKRDLLPEDSPRVTWLIDYSKYCLRQNLCGNVAEAGVYRGHFAYYINKYFADKTLYLFDTFEGFAETDVEKEYSLNNPNFVNGWWSGDRVKEIFKDTNENIVLSKMPYPKRCVIKKGYFPETTKDLNESFIFVSLDMDLYQPILECLRFFYPDMTGGGVILLHDYFDDTLPGVKMAVADYENENNLSLAKIPIGDNCSLAIIKV